MSSKTRQPRARTVAPRHPRVKNTTATPPWNPVSAVEDLAAAFRRVNALSRALVEMDGDPRDREVLRDLLDDVIAESAREADAHLAALDGWAARRRASSVTVE